MTWVKSVSLAALIGAAALFGAGTVAALLVDWYDISSFEGGAGFFVVGVALFGGIAGAAVGLVVARLEARRSGARFRRALALSVGITGAILGSIALGGWMLADIPPRIHGDELFLLTEIRWPEAAHPAPDGLDGVPYLRLGALQGRVARRVESGPVFVQDVRLEDHRWIVPGAVPIFTSRGGRLLEFGAGHRSIAGFVVPLPRYPGKAQQAWSEWLPAAEPGAAAPAGPFTYRFRVIRRSEPVRTETLGPFEIDTVAEMFYPSNGAEQMSARATFRIRHRGQPIPEVSVANSVAALRPDGAALLVTIAEQEERPPCALLVDEEPQLRVQPLTGCVEPMTPRVLTSDPARFAAAGSAAPPPGWVDRASFRTPGLLQIGSLVLDTRTYEAVSVPFPEDPRPDVSVPPLALAPDEQSFVWWALSGDDQPQLGVTNWRTGESYILPIDRSRMRFTVAANLDPEWVLHHFMWTRDASGRDVLAERPAFTPLPYRGEVVLGAPGQYQSYTLRPGGTPLRDAIVNLLVGELHGEHADSPSESFRQVRIDGSLVSVSVLGTPAYVHVSVDGDAGDPALMSRIAEALDRALATGRYDALFVPEGKEP